LFARVQKGVEFPGHRPRCTPDSCRDAEENALIVLDRSRWRQWRSIDLPPSQVRIFTGPALVESKRQPNSEQGNILNTTNGRGWNSGSIS
jgi:hypothetical protein